MSKIWKQSFTIEQLNNLSQRTLVENLGIEFTDFGDDFITVGVELNANHLSAATQGFVYGTARPFRLGRTLHVWGIEITDEAGKLICVSRLTIAIVTSG